MQTFLEFLAMLYCAIFTVAAIYINAVEHPARMSCGVKVALLVWVPSYKRATIMQTSLAVSGFVFSTIAWFMGANISVLMAGIVFVLAGPIYTDCH